MKLSDKLVIVAKWLESEENDLLVSADEHDECLEIVAGTLVAAASLLKTSAEEVSKIEPEVDSVVNEQSLSEMAALATAFDESGDELLQKQASVLDEILLTLAAPRGYVDKVKMIENDRLDQLKKRYKDVKKTHDEMNKVSDSIKDIEKSPAFKAYRPLEAPLNTRYCPDHPGAQIARVGEAQWQCMMDNKIYNFEAGYTTLKGNKVPGGNVSMQTPDSLDVNHEQFVAREDIMRNR
jgi:hypothetical protein